MKQSNEKRLLNTFMSYKGKIEFGDYLLFQEYVPYFHDGKEYHYKVSKPTLAIYLGSFIADQTLGFNYVKWNNDQRIVYVTNEHVTRYHTCKEVEQIDNHIEWNDFIDILGHWKCKPNWKEIIKAYRKQNTKQNDTIH